MYREYAQQLTSSIASLAAVNKLTAKERKQERTEEIKAGKTPLSKALMKARTDLADRGESDRDKLSEMVSEMTPAEEVTTRTSDEDLQAIAQRQVAAEHVQTNIESALAAGTKELTEAYQGIEDAYTSGKVSAKRAMKDLSTRYDKARKPVMDTIDKEEAEWEHGGQFTTEEVATRMADLRLKAAQREKERMNTARESLTNAGFILPGGDR